MKRLLTNWNFRKLQDLDIRTIIAPSEISTTEASESVTIPHTWYEDGNGYKGVVQYTASFRTEELHGKRIILRFLAAERYSRLFVNGHYIGEHKGGYSAFGFDITSACLESMDNTIVLFLDNRSYDEISPLTGDFTVFGGLYRNVELFITEEVCFDRTHFGTEGVIIKPYVDEYGNGILEIENHILGYLSDEYSLSYFVRDASGRDVFTLMGELNSISSLVIENPRLWNGRLSPELYTVTAVLFKSDQEIDSVRMETGFRNVHADCSGFYLNDSYLKLKGVARHQDYAGVFNTASADEYRRDIELIEEIGANAVRLSHYQHANEFYSLCDRKGFVVWAEIPMLKMIESQSFIDNAEYQLKELILQNMHHVSICFWGIQNEIAMFGESEYMYEKVSYLDHVAKSLDETRLTGSANLFCVKNDSVLNKITDVTGYNIYFGWYYGEIEDNGTFVSSFHKDNPEIPLLITEYGVDANPAFHSAAPSVKDYSEEYQALYHERVYPYFRDNDFVLGSFVWNMFDFSSEIRDEGGTEYRNAKGLVSYDRKLKKDAFYYYKAVWSSEPFVHIAGKRFYNRDSGKIDIRIYSNQNTVSLITEEETITLYSATGVFIFRDVSLKMGVNHFSAMSGCCSDEACFNRQDKADSSYIFVDNTPGIKVKNWFTDQVEAEIFPPGYFSIRDNVSVLMSNSEVWAVMEELLPSLAAELGTRKGDMPLERILAYKKNEITDQQCRILNKKLTQIKK